MNTVSVWAKARGTYRVVIPAQTGRVFRPNVGTPALCEAVPCPQPEVYVAEIPDALITGGSESIWVEGLEINDLVARHVGRMPAPRSAIPLRSYGSSYRSGVDPLAPTVIERGVMLTHQFAGNWFHWLVEQVSRLSLLDTDAPLLVDDGMPAQCYEALAAVTSLPVIRLERTSYLVRHLTVLSRLVWLPSDLVVPVAASDIVMAHEAIDFLRALGKPSKPTEKLYVERSGYQRLINKDEVRGVFERAGYRTIYPEGMTFRGQVELFGRALCVAGESGGGMTNILFAPPECTAICLQAPIEWNLFACLAGWGGQRASFVSGAPVANGLPYYQHPYRIDPAQLSEIV